MSRFEKLFEPLEIRGYTLKNRLESAPMAFGLTALNPKIAPKSYRKLESSARGGNAVVCLGEVDVNFKDAVRIPLPEVDFKEKDSYAMNCVTEYAKRIHKQGAIALAELVHPGAEKVPFDETQEAIGPNDEIRNGVKVRAMTEDDMKRICEDFKTAAIFMMNAGFDGIIVHGGHGFLLTQFLSPLYNKRTDEYNGSIENRAKFPMMILKAVREAIGEDKILELRLSGDDGQEGGITPDETGQFCHMLEDFVDMIQISVGLYYDPVHTHQSSSMFIEHGCNAWASAIIKKYTTIPVGVIGGINSPELAEEILAQGKADYIVLGRQSIADPFFAQKSLEGKEDTIRRCLRCYKCFPGSPEEGYKDLPFNTEQLAVRVGECAINPLANLQFDPFELGEAQEIKNILIVGGGVAGLQAAITAHDRGHKVTLVEKLNKLGGLLFFTDVDADKTDLMNFKNLMVNEVNKRNIVVKLNTEATSEMIKDSKVDTVIIAVGSTPITPSIKGIENAVQSLDAYKGNIEPGKKIIMIGGGLIGCEQGLFLQKTGCEVTVIEMAENIAKESYGMYREALISEMKKEKMCLYPKTKCIEMKKNSVVVERENGTQEELEADVVLFALGMKSVVYEHLKEAAGDRKVIVIGNAITPARIDQATKTGFMAALEAESEKYLTLRN